MEFGHIPAQLCFSGSIIGIEHLAAAFFAEIAKRAVFSAALLKSGHIGVDDGFLTLGKAVCAKRTRSVCFCPQVENGCFLRQLFRLAENILCDQKALASPTAARRRTVKVIAADSSIRCFVYV